MSHLLPLDRARPRKSPGNQAMMEQRSGEQRDAGQITTRQSRRTNKAPGQSIGWRGTGEVDDNNSWALGGHSTKPGLCNAAPWIPMALIPLRTPKHRSTLVKM